MIYESTHGYCSLRFSSCPTSLNRFAESLRKEQEKSKSALAAKLEARRQRKAALQKAQLDKQYILGEEAELRKVMTDRLKEEAELNEKLANRTSAVAKQVNLPNLKKYWGIFCKFYFSDAVKLIYNSD